jgi:hypothetical protein
MSPGHRHWHRASIYLALSGALLFSAGVVLASPGGATSPLPDIAGSPVAFGNAHALGAAPAQTASPEVGMATTPSGQGYWIDASDGGVFSFGDARFFGSMGGTHLNQPIVGMAATPDGGGYWLVASDGGIFTFGDARFFGSMGGTHLNQPVVGMAATPDGGGYTEVATDGGIFSFGDARFFGSAVGLASAPVVGISMTADGLGYWLAAQNGGVFALGDAPFFGSMGGQSLTDPIVGMAATPDGGGYWLLPAQEPRLALELPPISYGSTGAAVLQVQQALTNLGYWLGTPNGVFGDSTQQAVYALQKAAGLNPNGVVGPATYAAIAAGDVPQPQSTSGYVIEVDLQDDLVMFVDNGHLEYTINTSTGGGYIYDGNVLAATPVGHFSIYRAVNGLVVDSLGALWRPRYFTGGFAIHGDSNVPPEPVSHGCVRVSDEAIDWIWANNLAPIGTAVWVY